MAHVLDDFAAPPHAEIDVDIGHRNALGVQKALEEQFILHRIDVGNFQRVADQAPRGRSAAGTHRDALGSRVMNEIPNDQEVAGEAHLLDHFDFGGQAAFVIAERMAQAIFLGQPFQHLGALDEALAHHFFEVRIGGVAFWNFEFRERIADALDFYVAAIGDRYGARHRVRQFAKHLRHFLAALEIKLVGGEFHARGVAHGLAGLNAHQHFLGVRVRLGQVVAIVGGNQRDAAFFGQAHQVAVHANVLFEALVLHFEEEILFAENVAEAMRVGFGLVVLVGEDRVGHFPAQAGGQRNQALAVFGQQFMVDARLVIEPIEVAGGDQLDQVLVAGLVFAQEDEVV